MNSRFYVEQGDCMELMAKLPDHSVDFLLTDPPYGITNFKWDKPQDWDRFWREAKRVCKPNAAMALFSCGKFTLQLMLSNTKDWRYKYVWHKQGASPVGFLDVKRRPLRSYEEVNIFYSKLPTYTPQLRDAPNKKPNKNRAQVKYGPYGKNIIPSETGIAGKRYPTDVLSFCVLPRDRGGGHPSQKPLSLLEFLIKTYSNEGETVLDPFMGSGSTGRAALNCNRRFIGFELDPDYFASAKDWLKPQYDTNEKRPK